MQKLSTSVDVYRSYSKPKVCRFLGHTVHIRRCASLFSSFTYVRRLYYACTLHVACVLCGKLIADRSSLLAESKLKVDEKQLELETVASPSRCKNGQHAENP